MQAQLSHNRLERPLSPLSIEWQKYMPHYLGKGKKYLLDSLVTPELMDFMKQHKAIIYFNVNAETPFDWLEQRVDKVTFYEQHIEKFAVRFNNTLVGIIVVQQADWSTYYLRNASILPDHQGQNIWQDWLLWFEGLMVEHHIKRIEGDVVPTNRRQIHIFNKLGFFVTGYCVSERYGSTIKFTKYVDKVSEQSFCKNLCVSL